MGMSFYVAGFLLEFLSSAEHPSSDKNPDMIFATKILVWFLPEMRS